MDDQDDIVTRQLLGRDMQFRRITPGQQLLMVRMSRRAQGQLKDGDADTIYADLMIKMLDMIESLFVSDQDRQDVEDALLTGKLPLEELQQVALGAKAKEEVPDDADPVVAPKALKSKKAAPTTTVNAKKTANPRRAAR
jgi:hypothetical protein